MSDEISWSQDMMLEVALKEPDDFLKVRETLTRIGVASVRIVNCTSHAISCIRRASITLSISKNCSRWTASPPTSQRTTSNVVIASLNFCLTGVL